MLLMKAVSRRVRWLPYRLKTASLRMLLVSKLHAIESPFAKMRLDLIRQRVERNSMAVGGR
jgi:hypothetical protein